MLHNTDHNTAYFSVPSIKDPLKEIKITKSKRRNSDLFLHCNTQTAEIYHAYAYVLCVIL